MDSYNVTGMSCAACQARVEKAVSKLEGVSSCSVSLLTNSMAVEGEASPETIIHAVEDAGYGASLKGAANTNSRRSLLAKLAEEEEALKDKTTPVLKKRLITSLGFLLVLMYFSMGHMMLGLPLPAFFEGNQVAIGLAQMVLAAIVMVINQKFFINGFRGLVHRAPNMDSLIALGSMSGFVYSTIILFAMTRAVVDGDTVRVGAYMKEFYFESSAMILTLITVGKMLESYSKGKTTNALRSLMDLAPKTATVLRNGAEQTISIDEVETGDLFVVRPGETIPVDGVVIEGSSAVNEAALTGESIPVDKEAGDKVSSATLNQSGFLTCRATRVGEDTSLAQIIQMVGDAAASKAPVAKLADTISGIFVPVVIGIALLTFLVWMALGQPIGFSLARAITVLVVSCPCALGLATPVAIMVGNGVGAKNGILFKNAQALQETGGVQIVALDKTGTITKGEPVVTDLCPGEGVTQEELLSLAYSLEQKSEHPLAKAVLLYGKERAATAHPLTDFTALPGNGLMATLEGEPLRGGNEAFIRRFVSLDPQMQETAATLALQGKTPLFFARGEKLLGLIAVADVMKEDSAQAISQLQGMGIHVVMLTGDNARTAKAIGEQAGVDEVIAGVLPEGKEEVIRSLQERGKVAMVGDGINDAPALTRADIGIAIGTGTDVAMDAADVVLMKSSLMDVPAALRLSRATYWGILQNLFWALFYNALLIPAAAGVYIKAFGITMNPMLGAAAMSLSSFCVVTNALRLNLVDIYDASKDKKRRKKARVGAAPDQEWQKAEPQNETTEKTKEEAQMCTKTLTVEGMMCEHCEARVKKTLEALEGVSQAVVSKDTKTAVVTCDESVSDETMKNAVEAQDYKVTNIA